MDGNEKSPEKTEAEATAEILRQAADRLIKQERTLAQVEQGLLNLNKVLLPKRYLVTNKITGEKEVSNLDEIFSEMIRHLDMSGTLEGWLTKYNVLKLKEETADILYGKQQTNLSK